MTLYIPQASLVALLTDILGESFTLKLFSNNITPAVTDTAASYTEVSGGGYATKTLTAANWIITPGDPSVALYNAVQDFNFTGTTTAPGTVYGYFIIRVSDLTLVYAERFPPANVPLTPVNGSLIRLTPRITAGN